MAEDFSLSTTTVSGIKMDIQLTMKRIQNARRAMVRAQNPWFRTYWDKVANELHTKMVETYG